MGVLTELLETLELPGGILMSEAGSGPADAGRPIWMPSGLDSDDSAGHLPVYRNGTLAGFVARPADPDTERNSQRNPQRSSLGGAAFAPLRDVRIRAELVRRLRQENWVAADLLQISVEDGVVHLMGEVDSLQAVLALRRITAATQAIAMIDDLWIACD